MANSNTLNFDVEGENVSKVAIRVVKPSWTRRLQLEVSIYLHNGQMLIVHDTKPVVAQINAANNIHRTQVLEEVDA